MLLPVRYRFHLMQLRLETATVRLTLMSARRALVRTVELVLNMSAAGVVNARSWQSTLATGLRIRESIVNQRLTFAGLSTTIAIRFTRRVMHLDLDITHVHVISAGQVMVTLVLMWTSV